MNNLEIIEDFINAFNTYKNPPEMPPVLERILRAAGIGKYDYVNSIRYDEEHEILYVYVQWYIRGCLNDSDYEIPLSVILSDNPEKTMEIITLREKIKKLENTIEVFSNTLNEMKDELIVLNTELENKLQ